MERCKECDKLTAADGPETVVVYSDPFFETGRTTNSGGGDPNIGDQKRGRDLFCSRRCRSLCDDDFSTCEFCKRFLWMKDEGELEEYVPPGGKWIDDCTEICMRCLSMVLLEKGQNSTDFCKLSGKSLRGYKIRSYSLDVFRLKTPLEYGYVQVPGFANMNIDYDNFNKNYYDPLVQCALSCISNNCNVILLENFVEPLRGPDVKFKNVTLWCYGWYRNVARSAVLTWMLCARSLLCRPKSGYSHPKDISKMIGKMVYASRNNQQVWITVPVFSEERVQQIVQKYHKKRKIGPDTPKSE